MILGSGFVTVGMGLLAGAASVASAGEPLPCGVCASGIHARGVAGSCGATVLGAAPVTGVQRIGVFMVDNGGDDRQDLAFVQDAMFTASNSIAAFYDWASGGRVTLTGDVHGWFETGPGCFPDEAGLLADIADRGIDARQYDLLFFVFNESAGCGAAGTSSVGKREVMLADGNHCASVSYAWVPFYGLDFSRTTQSTVAHEIGHAFGIPYHPSAFHCPDAVPFSDPDNCFEMPYGDLWDMMGLRLQASMFNNLTLEQLGWLEPTEQVTVTEPGVYTLDPVEQAGGIRMIRIPVPTPITVTSTSGHTYSTDELALELRDYSSFDYRTSFYRNIATTDGATFPVDPSGVIVRFADVTQNPFPVMSVIDMRSDSINESYVANEAADGYLYEGDSYALPNGGVSITVEQLVPFTSARVRVEFLPAACSAADLAEPYSVLNSSDVNAFVAGFLAGGEDSPADLAEPLGVLNSSDVNGFVAAFLAGCP